MEHILSSQIMHHIESQGIICETQFGFRQKHSCEIQLLLTIDDFARATHTHAHTHTQTHA